MRMRVFALAVAMIVAAAAPVLADTWLNPVDYGAKIDGATPDNAAWAAVEADSVARGLPILMPCGVSVVTAPIVITGGKVPDIVGAGYGCSKIVATAGPSVFDVETVAPVRIANLTVGCGAANQAGIDVSPANQNRSSDFERVGADHCNIGFSLTNASTWTIEGAYVSAGGVSGAIGVLVGNETNADAGDSTIRDSWVIGNSASGGSMAILQKSSGGLRVKNNKIMMWDHGYVMRLAASAVTGDLIISDNSIENMTVDSVLLTHAGNSKFSRVVINGNQIGGIPTCITVSGAGWLDQLVMVGNELNCTLTSPGGVAHKVVGSNL